MSKSNQEKSKQLGMPFGTASNRLRKQIMFRMMQKCGEDVCHQCGEKIEDIDKLSIEHKIKWLHSDDPPGLFFDLDNVVFSHLHCNIKNGRKGREAPGHTLIPCPSEAAYQRGCRCGGCKEEHARLHKEYRENRKEKQR